MADPAVIEFAGELDKPKKNRNIIAPKSEDRSQQDTSTLVSITTLIRISFAADHTNFSLYGAGRKLCYS